MATSLIPMSLSASPDPAAGLDLGSPVPLAAIPRSLKQLWESSAAVTRACAVRSCASKNSWGGTGCISDMALYGKGSFTLNTSSRAPVSRASEAAACRARVDISDPSVGTRIRWYIANLLVIYVAPPDGAPGRSLKVWRAPALMLVKRLRSRAGARAPRLLAACAVALG